MSLLSDLGRVGVGEGTAMGWLGQASVLALKPHSRPPGPSPALARGQVLGAPSYPAGPVPESPASQEAHASQAGGSWGPGLQPQLLPPCRVLLQLSLGFCICKVRFGF